MGYKIIYKSKGNLAMRHVVKNVHQCQESTFIFDPCVMTNLLSIISALRMHWMQLDALRGKVFPRKERGLKESTHMLQRFHSWVPPGVTMSMI